MRSVREHRAAILAALPARPPVRLPLEEAVGLVLADDVVSEVALPRFDNSAMDGYTGRAQDLAGIDPEHPRSLRVTGDVAAGDTEHRTVEPGELWRIMTGAPMPEGADTVVPVEDTDGRPREVLVRSVPDAGAHVRRAGEDVSVGDVLVPAGVRIGPPQVAALGSANVATVSVVPPVRVAVLSTGDELVPVGAHVGPGQIVDSNTPMLVAAVRAAGHEVAVAQHLPDDEKATRRAFTEHLSAADAIVTTGGVSMGAFDVVKAVLGEDDDMWFGPVAMQPGKPQGFGVLGDRRVPVFTLPGNPVSTLVSFEVFVRPALAVLAGRPGRTRTVRAVVHEGWRSPAGREQYARVRLVADAAGGYGAVPAGGPGSHLVGGLAGADGLALVATETTQVEAGTEVDVIPFAALEELEVRIRPTEPDEGSQDR